MPIVGLFFCLVALGIISLKDKNKVADMHQKCEEGWGRGSSFKKEYRLACVYYRKIITYARGLADRILEENGIDKSLKDRSIDYEYYEKNKKLIDRIYNEFNNMLHIKFRQGTRCEKFDSSPFKSDYEWKDGIVTAEHINTWSSPFNLLDGGVEYNLRRLAIGLASEKMYNDGYCPMASVWCRTRSEGYNPMPHPCGGHAEEIKPDELVEVLTETKIERAIKDRQLTTLNLEYQSQSELKRIEKERKANEPKIFTDENGGISWTTVFAFSIVFGVVALIVGFFFWAIFIL